jgi:hypothetical protein
LRRVTLVALLGLVAVGCSGKDGGIQGVNVKGKIVKNGQVIPMQGDHLTIFIVSLAGDQERGIRSMGIYSPADGTFECRGPLHKGIPEGEYRIELWPGRAEFPPYRDNLFNFEFKDEKSPLKVTLTKANAEKLLVDVGTKTVTSQ